MSDRGTSLLSSILAILVVLVLAGDRLNAAMRVNTEFILVQAIALERVSASVNMAGEGPLLIRYWLVRELQSCLYQETQYHGDHPKFSLLKDVERTLEMLVDLDTSNYRVLPALWHLYLVDGQCPRAVNVLERAYALSPMDRRVIFQIGIVRFVRGDYLGSAELWAPHSEMTNLLVEAATWYLEQLKQPRRAVDLLEAVVIMGDTRNSTLYNLGRAYQDLGDNASAVRLYHKVVSTHTNAAPDRYVFWAQFRIGQVRFAERRWQDALNELTQTWNFDPGGDQLTPYRADLHYWQALTHMKLGQIPEARANLLAARTLALSDERIADAIKRLDGQSQ